MSSTEESLGKDIGNDIRNGKKTLIAVHALTYAESENKKVLNRIFGKRDANEDEIQKVYSIFRETGSIEYAKQKALMYSSKAIHVLDDVADNDAKKILIGLAKYAITREN